MALLTAAEEAVDGVLEAAHNVADGIALAAASTAPALREGNIGDCGAAAAATTAGGLDGTPSAAGVGAPDVGAVFASPARPAAAAGTGGRRGEGDHGVIEAARGRARGGRGRGCPGAVRDRREPA